MIKISGKYNVAHVMIDQIDQSTRDQILSFVNHPAFANTYISIMPDCHAGKGAVVGFTMKMNNYIIPNIIGVDIGCGMLMAKYAKEEINLEDFDNFIKMNIPSGFHIHEKNEINLDELSEIKDVCDRLSLNFDKVVRSIGTLGGGNHFIELGRDSFGFLTVTIHTGSRNFGKTIAEFYQKKAKSTLEKYLCAENSKDLEYFHIDDDDAKSYLNDLRIAQRFASMNREAILDKISEFMGKIPVQRAESIHNFIGDDNIIRKGATSANSDDIVIIPFNMKDGIAVCEGRGNSQYNNSAPHGAGRILSRAQAKKTLNVDNFVQQMSTAGVFTTTANASTLDESPDAYKPMNIILENIKETVDVIEFIKPIYNFKAGE